MPLSSKDAPTSPGQQRSAEEAADVEDEPELLTSVREAIEGDTKMLDAAVQVSSAEAVKLFEDALEARRVYNEDKNAEAAAKEAKKSK